MALNILLNPVFDLWALIITGFVVWQIWNIFRSFKVGKIYNLWRHPMWGVDKEGKWHVVVQADKKESPASFMLARISAIFFLIMSILIWAITIGVIVF